MRACGWLGFGSGSSYFSAFVTGFGLNWLLLACFCSKDRTGNFEFTTTFELVDFFFPIFVGPTYFWLMMELIFDFVSCLLYAADLVLSSRFFSKVGAWFYNLLLDGTIKGHFSVSLAEYILWVFIPPQWLDEKMFLSPVALTWFRLDLALKSCLPCYDWEWLYWYLFSLSLVLCRVFLL